MEERLSAEPHARLRYFCSPYHAHSALYPVIRQLERAAGLLRGDSPDMKLDKLEALLRQAASDVAQIAPLVAELLSIDLAGRYAPVGLTRRRESRVRCRPWSGCSKDSRRDNPLS